MSEINYILRIIISSYYFIYLAINKHDESSIRLIITKSDLLKKATFIGKKTIKGRAKI